MARKKTETTETTETNEAKAAPPPAEEEECHPFNPHELARDVADLKRRVTALEEDSK